MRDLSPPAARVCGWQGTADGIVRGFAISDQEVADVVAFLESLTDDTFVNNPAFAPP